MVSDIVVPCAVALPVLALLLFSIVSLVAKVPLARGIGNGLRTIALPCACVLFVLYGVLLMGTLRQDAVMNAGLQQTVQQEAPFLAQQAGMEWPGPVK